MSTITAEHVARIEGHGTITVDVEDRRVTDVHMDIVEPARFFESMVVGRRYDEIPVITSRICGICSPTHTVTALKAVEAVMGIQVSERTELLRRLLIYGSFMQNHATHLYVFAAPDFVGLPSVFPLAQSAPDVLHRALKIKKAGNSLTTLIGGRPVHPITAVLGGFSSEPSRDALEEMREVLIDLVQDAEETVRLFASFDVPDFAMDGDMLALVSDGDYAIYDGVTASFAAGWRRPVEEYREFISETVVGHSNAKHSTVGGRSFMVGALARLNLSGDELMPRAGAVMAEIGLKLPCENSFYNNLAQAVELVDACERCIGYLDQLIEDGGTSAPIAFTVRSGTGIAATEAPRGTVYHSYTFDDAGIVIAGDIITPTAQNLSNLDSDMRLFAPGIVDLARESFLLEMEKLVRAYDLCLSCSVH